MEKIIYFLIILILLNNINNIKYFNKELVMSKTNNEDFENSTKCWVCNNHYIDNDVKLRDHYHTTGQYWVSAHRVCNINVCNIKLNHKIPVVFCSLINHDSHLFTQELGKFNLKIDVIPNGLENYMSFSINNKLSFIYRFQFLSFLLASLVKKSNKNDFKCLSQEFYNNVLDLVKQKGFYPQEYMNDFEKSKEELPSKEKFYSSLAGKKLVAKNIIMF